MHSCFLKKLINEIRPVPTDPFGQSVLWAMAWSSNLRVAGYGHFEHCVIFLISFFNIRIYVILMWGALWPTCRTMVKHIWIMYILYFFI